MNITEAIKSMKGALQSGRTCLSLAAMSGCLVAALAHSPAALAAATITTKNNLNYSMWITAYDLGKTRHLDYGCVPAGNWRAWTSGNYLIGSYYYFRAQVQDSKDCKGKTLCDTTIQIRVSNKPGPNPFKSESQVLYLKVDNKKPVSSCYWDEPYIDGNR